MEQLQFHRFGYIYYPTDLRIMKDYALMVVKYKETIRKYYSLLEPGQRKNEIYWEGLVGIENIVKEVKNIIQEHEAEWPGNFMTYMANSKALKKLEYQLESIETRYSRIKEMYYEAKERV